MLRKIVRPVYLNENTINFQVRPGDKGERMVMSVNEIPTPADSGDELTMVDREDYIVKDEFALNDTETTWSRTVVEDEHQSKVVQLE
jgi:hypothetical protein